MSPSRSVRRQQSVGLSDASVGRAYAGHKCCVVIDLFAQSCTAISMTVVGNDRQFMKSPTPTPQTTVLANSKYTLLTLWDRDTARSPTPTLVAARAQT
jgi:hypothetical protein